MEKIKSSIMKMLDSCGLSVRVTYEEVSEDKIYEHQARAVILSPADMEIVLRLQSMKECYRLAGLYTPDYKAVSFEQHAKIVVAHELGHCEDAENVEQLAVMLRDLSDYAWANNHEIYRDRLKAIADYKVELEVSAWKIARKFISEEVACKEIVDLIETVTMDISKAFIEEWKLKAFYQYKNRRDPFYYFAYHEEIPPKETVVEKMLKTLDAYA